MGKYYITNKAAADLANMWDGHVGRGGTAENANRLIAELLESFQTLYPLRLIPQGINPSGARRNEYGLR